MTKERLKFEPSRIKNYEFLKQKLKMILSANKQVKDFQFFGVKAFDTTQHNVDQKQKYGILVVGTDSGGISSWNKFFSIGEIKSSFDTWCRREKLDGVIN